MVASPSAASAWRATAGGCSGGGFRRRESAITEANATKYVGKYVLVGITPEDAFGNVIDQFQIHGVIELVASAGITIALRGVRQGEYYVVPPILEPGEYRLHSTGEVVIDPDYVTTFTITPPQKH